MKPKLLLGLTLVLSGGLAGCTTTGHGELSAKQRALLKEALATLKPDMTEQYVMDTLSKTQWRHHVYCVEGGGSLSHYWSLYPMDNGDSLILFFNCKYNPPRFQEYELYVDGRKQND